MCPINSSWGLTYLLCIGLWLHAGNANLCTSRQAPFNNFQKLLHWWWNICQLVVINFCTWLSVHLRHSSSGSLELSLVWAQAAIFAQPCWALWFCLLHYVAKTEADWRNDLTIIKSNIVWICFICQICELTSLKLDIDSARGKWDVWHSVYESDKGSNWMTLATGIQTVWVTLRSLYCL